MANKYDVTEHTGFPRPRIQPGGEEHLRQPSQVQVPDIEQAPLKYIALALVHLRNAFSAVPKMLEDNSKPVDEYRVQTLAPDSETGLSLLPQWESAELIRSVLITGPTGSITVQLGDRVWNLTIPASGFILISPLWLQLARDEPRTLTSATPGDYTMELMGHADERALP